MATSQQTLGAHTGPDGATSSREDYPSELDPYWPSRIAEDRTWYGHFVEPDERFYDSRTGRVYRITDIQHNHDVFTLEPCAVATDPNGEFEQPTAADHEIDNICSLAGTIELGELIHLKKGTIREVGDTTYFSIGQLTLEIQNAGEDPDALLAQIEPPEGPTTTDLAKITPTLADADAEATLYAPRSASADEQPNPHPTTQRAPDGAQDVETHFIPVSPFSKWTFEDATIKDWVESTFEPGETILNVCAGETKLTPPPGGEILRNDISKDRPADFHVDVAELAGLEELQAESISRIIFDPPWSLYQANLRYDKNHVHQVSKEDTHDIDLSKLPFETPTSDEKTQLGHAAIAKRGFDHLLEPGGEVVEFTLHGTSMPSNLGYKRQARVVFDPVGEARCVIGSIDRKTRQKLSSFV